MHKLLQQLKGNIPVRWSGWPFWTLLALALALRLYGLGQHSFFNDELSAIIRTHAENNHDFIENCVIPDYHPAGIQWFLWKWTKLAGYSHFMVRLPFAIAGTLSVLFLFLTGRIWFGERTAWLAAAALACLQFPVYFSQLARPYSSGLLFIMLEAWFFSKMNAAAGRRLRYRLLLAAGAGISISFAMYNHYFSFFMAGITGITLFLLQKPKMRFPAFLSGILALGLFYPHLDISRIQISRGGLSTWLGPPDTSWFREHLLYIFNNSLPVAILFLLFVIPLLYRLSRQKKPGISRHLVYIAAGLWIFALMFAFLYSLLVNPILQHSIMLFAFPFLLLALFYGAGHMSQHWFNPVALLFPVVLTAHLVFGTGYYSRNQYSDFRTNAEMVCKTLRENPSAKWVTQVNNPAYIHYYLDQFCHPDSAITYFCDDRMSIQKLSQTLDSLEINDLAFTWLRPFDPLITSVIRQHFPYLKSYHSSDYFDEFYHFSKTPSSQFLKEYHYDSIPLTITSGQTLPMIIGSEDEYLMFYDHEISYEPASPNIPAVVHCSLAGGSDVALTDLQLVITTEKTNGAVDSWNSLPLSFYNPLGDGFFFTAALPPSHHKKLRLKVFLWNPKHETFRLEKCNLYLVLAK
jgi:hypothetical protein